MKNITNQELVFGIYNIFYISVKTTTNNSVEKWAKIEMFQRGNIKCQLAYKKLAIY